MSLAPWATADPEYLEFMNTVQPFCCTTFLPTPNSTAEPVATLIASVNGRRVISPPPSIENRSVVMSALGKAEWIVKLGLLGDCRPAIRTFFVKSDVQQDYLLEVSRGQDNYRKLFPEHADRFSDRDWIYFKMKCSEHGTVWLGSYYGLKSEEPEATSAALLLM